MIMSILGMRDYPREIRHKSCPDLPLEREEVPLVGKPSAGSGSPFTYELQMEVDLKEKESSSWWGSLKRKNKQPKWTLRVRGEFLDQHFRVYIPPAENEKIPPPFLETLLIIQDQPIRLGIDVNNVAKRLKPLMQAEIITEKDIADACAQKIFDQFMQTIERPWHWKIHLRHLLPIAKTLRALKHLHTQIPIWKETAMERGRIFITAKRIGSFEYTPEGTVWLHHSHMHQETILPLATDLDKGITYQTVELPKELGERIERYRPFFTQETEGLIYFQDFCPTERKIFAKHALYDTTLDKVELPVLRKARTKIACDLLRGLRSLETEKIVHCGVFSCHVHIRYNQREIIEVALGGVEWAHFADALPEKLRTSFKWKEFMPPECNEPTDRRTHPYAIPIYQLGMCLKPLFDPDSPLAATVKSMIDPDPARRISIEEALDAFEGEFKEPLAADPPDQ